MKKNIAFTDLEVYKACRILRKRVRLYVEEYFPKHEKYNLTDQVIRSSRSVTANIAEGHGRYYYQDNIRFCRMSRGSLQETLEHFITAFDEEYINSETLKEFKEEYDTCMRLLNGYTRYLLNNKNKEFG